MGLLSKVQTWQVVKGRDGVPLDVVQLLQQGVKLVRHERRLCRGARRERVVELDNSSQDWSI